MNIIKSIAGLIGQQSKAQTIAVVLTAVSTMPVYQAFSVSPLMLGCVIVLGIAYVIAGGHIGKSGTQTAICLPVYGISSLLFGFFAMFQVWRILVRVFAWIDSVLLTFFQWIQ